MFRSHDNLTNTSDVGPLAGNAKDVVGGKRGRYSTTPPEAVVRLTVATPPFEVEFEVARVSTCDAARFAIAVHSSEPLHVFLA